jgi:hypothetical protein
VKDAEIRSKVISGDDPAKMAVHQIVWLLVELIRLLKRSDITKLEASGRW